MLGRNSSNRLSRRKSTSSVHSKHESINPEVARQHAHTAATLAFARAQERNSADVGRRAGGISRSNALNQHNQESSHQTDATNNGDRVIKRQHSVRFVGPNAVQRRQSIGSRAIHSQIVPQKSTATLRPMALTTNASVPAAYRPPSRSSSIGKASVSKATAESFVTANIAYDEYYTREDDVASTPSSYRRIRRSKSMFSPLQAPSIFYTNGTPDRPESSRIARQDSFITSKSPQSQSPRGPLRAPKSMSFLRGGRDHLTAALRERNDAAVQMARDRFFHQTTQQRLREQPSFLFRSKTQKQEKTFRKSVRSSSANSTLIPISSAENQTQKESSLKDAARKASRTIRSKLKRVFGRTKDEIVEIPNQQVDARETHVRQYIGDATSTHNQFSNIPYPTEASLSRVASRVPSLHAATSNQELRSHAGSVKSFVSDHSDGKSRVTSWNSTGVNTVSSQAGRIQAERDQQQRLSIINENGTHISSSSFNRPKVKNQFSAYPLLHRPSKSAGHVVAPVPGPVDSARVYSALMKRLDENSPKAKLEASRKASMEGFTAANQVLIPGSSVKSKGNQASPATIRHVTAEGSSNSNGSGGSLIPDHDHKWVRADSIHSARAEDVFGHTGSHVHQWAIADPLREARMRYADDVFSPKENAANKENIPVKEFEGPGSSSSHPSRQNSTKTSYYTVPEALGLTPQELAIRNEPSIQGTKVVREARSTFFGGSSSFTISRTPSPFRRALAEAENHLKSNLNQPPVPARISPLRNPLYLGSESLLTLSVDTNGAQNSEKAYSESVYSRTTSGQTPAAANSTLSLALADEDILDMPFVSPGNGDVVIIDRTTYRPVMPVNKGHRVTSSAGSTEWKKWMSSEVAKLERAKENTNTLSAYINYALPTMPRSFNSGHVRESAQIDDDDTEVAQPKGPVVKQPLGIILQNPNLQNVPILKPILKNRSAISLVESTAESTSNAPPIPVPPPPPIPVRSPLRPMQSKSSLRSVATPNSARTGSAPSSAVKISSLSGRSVLHKRNVSSTTLRSTKSVETPAKLVKRSGRPLNYNSNNPSPGGGLTAATDMQFGSMSTRSRIPGRDNRENLRAKEEKDYTYGSDGAGLMGPGAPLGVGEIGEQEAQAMGSKRMVDLFLSSRRKRIASGSDENGGQVFL